MFKTVVATFRQLLYWASKMAFPSVNDFQNRVAGDLRKEEQASYLLSIYRDRQDACSTFCGCSGITRYLETREKNTSNSPIASKCLGIEPDMLEKLPLEKALVLVADCSADLSD